MTDALVSELRADCDLPDGKRSRVLVYKAADSLTFLQSEVERLTRELAEAASLRDRYSAGLEICAAQKQMLTAERDAARRELAECRNKTLDEAIGACCPHQDDDAMDRQAKHEVARKIIALKTEA